MLTGKLGLKATLEVRVLSDAPILNQLIHRHHASNPMDNVL